MLFIINVRINVQIAFCIHNSILISLFLKFLFVELFQCFLNWFHESTFVTRNRFNAKYVCAVCEQTTSGQILKILLPCSYISVRQTQKFGILHERYHSRWICWGLRTICGSMSSPTLRRDAHLERGTDALFARLLHASLNRLHCKLVWTRLLEWLPKGERTRGFPRKVQAKGEPAETR